MVVDQGMMDKLDQSRQTDRHFRFKGSLGC